MQEKMKAFLEAAAQDPALVEALEKAETPDAVIALAKEAGFALTEADLAEMTPPTGELSDDALEDVAGGMILNPLTALGGLAALIFRRFGGRKNTNTLSYRSTGTAPTATTLQFNSMGSKPVMSDLVNRTMEDDEGKKLYRL